MPRFLRRIRLALGLHGLSSVPQMAAEPAHRVANRPGTPVVSDYCKLPRDHIGENMLARVLAGYVRDKKVLTLEEALRTMSSFPAMRIGLTERGVLRPGMKTDIAVFDSARVKDMATYDKPHQYAVGFDYVTVNGQIAYEGGAMTAARPGRVLYGAGKSSDQR